MTHMDGAVEDYTAQERAVLVAVAIWEGAELTTAEIAERAGVTRQGAYTMICKISRVLPIAQVEGRWRRFDAV